VTIFTDYFIRTDVEQMSKHVFGVSYRDAKSVIYPSPSYKTFVITKRNGNPRIIHEPRKALKDLQRKILSFLESIAGPPKSSVHGFVKSRSIVTNAKKHLEKRPHHILNIDLENFFPTITFFRVRGVLLKAPFNFSYSVATVLAHACTYHNSLPQGAPTSPFFSNLVCRSLDRDLASLARRHRTVYTRYADDITFSFSKKNASSLPSNIVVFGDGELQLGHELREIISKHSFKINQDKVRMSMRTHRMEITGIVVNEFPNVKRAYINEIRGALSAWGKHGYDLAQEEWERKNDIGKTLFHAERPWKRQIRRNIPPQLQNYLWGKLLYLRMVRGKDDTIYTRLAERYNKLCDVAAKKSKSFSASALPVEPIVRNNSDVDKAVFVLEWEGNYHNSKVVELVGVQGTAFCYKKKNILITCNHVLTWRGKFKDDEISETVVDCQSSDLHDLELTIHNPTTGKKWDVKVLHRDADRDLAILEIIGDATSLRYFSGADVDAKQQNSGTLIGFPNWSIGRPVNLQSAVVLSQYPLMALQRFEISVMIRQGNSGGLFVDGRYRVLGVAQQGAQQDKGNNECLCLSELDSWITSVSPTPIS